MNATAPAATPEHLNEAMIAAITGTPPYGTSDPRVLAAVRAVPRHLFVPGATLDDAYNPALAVITRRDAAGNSLSCASVPSLVGAMLEQLAVRGGDRVFEGGAGTGWNAALLATIVGPDGAVSTIDIDPGITAEARENLDRAGFSRVHVATGGAALGVPENAPYDRAVITIGSLDIPPAWISQLKPGGRIVVPLRWRGQTQSVALTLGDDGILRSEGSFTCGFVPMIGQDWERTASIDPHDLVRLYWDADQDIDPARLAGVLDSPAARADSGVTVGPEEPLDQIWVRATATDPAVCRISAEPAAVTSGLCTPFIRARTLALAEGDSVAYLTIERLGPPTHRARVGAAGHGPDAAALADRLCAHVAAWEDDRTAMPDITVYPKGTAPRTGDGQVIVREHCEMTVEYA